MEHNFCGKCGSEVDKKTGLCPNCDIAALEKVLKVNTKRSLKKAKCRGVTAIIALILVIAIVVSSVVFAFSKAWIGNNSEEDKKKVQTTYITYLNNTIIPEIGEYDSNLPESSNEGVHSALFCDLNNDDKEEFVVAYSKENGNNIDFNISCYEYNTEAKEPEKSEENVELIGTVTPSTEPDYTKDNDDVFHLPNETIVYSITYKNETFIVCEHMSWMDIWSYECHIYKIDKGLFVEVSNIFVPNIGTDGTRIVYSRQLPDKLLIDNSDFNVDMSGTQEYNKGVFYKEDCKVLFYSEGGNSTYVYDKYYDSEESAVADFFKFYGIENRQYHTIRNDHISINHPDKSDLIYSYCYYWEYDEDGNTIEKYEINDYTDWKSLIGNDDSEQAAKSDEIDISNIISDAAFFAHSWFYDNTHTDKSKTIIRYITEAWGSYDCEFELVNDKSVKSKNDLITLTNKYFSSSVTEDLMYMQQWYEENNQLYVTPSGGIGDWLVDKYEIVVQQESETKYILKIIGFIGDEITDYPHDVSLELINGNWVLDEIFAFNKDVEINVIDETSSDFNKYQQYYEYLEVLLNGYCQPYSYFCLFDIDNNGVLELIAVRDDSESDLKYDFYTYDNKIINLGNIPAGHSILMFSDFNNGLYSYYSHMGSSSLTQIKLKDNIISADIINDGQAVSKSVSDYDSLEYYYLQDGYSDTLDPAIYENLRIVLK